VIDPTHSEVSFTVRHLMVSKVRGTFTKFSGTITIGDDPLESSVEAAVDLASIDTREPNRDAHLRSPDFFHTDQYPEMTYRSTAVRADGDGFLVETEAGKMHDVLEQLEKKGMKPLHSEVGMYPDNSVRLEGDDAAQMVKLVQALEDHDDVQNVYANYDIDDKLMEQLSASA
jgi:hypothetical protein